MVYLDLLREKGDKWMFRIWAKEWKSNHLIKDMTVCNDNPEMNRTAKVFAAIDTVCNELIAIYLSLSVTIRQGLPKTILLTE